MKNMNLTLVGRLSPCFLLSYAIPPCQAAKLVPDGLELITYSDCAFLNVVVCRVERMRPSLAPRWLGMTYWHVAYRLHVRAKLKNSRSIEGLYFLRSDVERPLLGVVGNWLTDFRFHRAKIRFSRRGVESSVEVQGSHDGCGNACLHVRSLNSDNWVGGSPFASLEERERVLKYAPVSMAVSGSGRRLHLAEVSRDEAAWSEEPLEVEDAEWTYLRSVGFDDLKLARATEVRPIDYRWSLGRREWMQPGV